MSDNGGAVFVFGVPRRFAEPPGIPPGHPGTFCPPCSSVPLEQACNGCPRLVQAQRDRDRVRADTPITPRLRRPWWRRLREESE